MSEDRASETGCAEIIDANLPALRALCRRFGVRRLDLFGSAVTGRFDPARSDLDFLVEFEQPLAGGFASPYFGLLEALETLFGRHVDPDPGRPEKSLFAPADIIRKADAVSAAMINNQVARYLWDVRTAAENINEFTAGRGFDDDSVEDH